jgi:hypothetical protein
MSLLGSSAPRLREFSFGSLAAKANLLTLISCEPSYLNCLNTEHNMDPLSIATAWGSLAVFVFGLVCTSYPPILNETYHSKRLSQSCDDNFRHDYQYPKCG